MALEHAAAKLPGRFARGNSLTEPGAFALVGMDAVFTGIVRPV